MQNIDMEISPILERNQVHIWYIRYKNFDTMTSKVFNMLSPDEITRASEYKFSIHRKQFVYYRKVLREILSLYYCIESQDIHFEYTEYGKPYVANDLISDDIYFNLSHSEDVAVLGVTKNNLLGIDIEYTKYIDNIDNIARQFFSSSEYNKFVKLPSEDKTGCFYEIWTRKEAFIKAIGEGLSYPLDSFEVSFNDFKKPRLIHINGSSADALKWTYKCSSFDYKGKKYALALSVNNVNCDYIDLQY